MFVLKRMPCAKCEVISGTAEGKAQCACVCKCCTVLLCVYVNVVVVTVLKISFVQQE